MTFVIHIRNSDFCHRIVLVGGLAIQLKGLSVILWNAKARIIHPT